MKDKMYQSRYLWILIVLFISIVTTSTIDTLATGPQQWAAWETPSSTTPRQLYLRGKAQLSPTPKEMRFRSKIPTPIAPIDTTEEHSGVSPPTSALPTLPPPPPRVVTEPLNRAFVGYGLDEYDQMNDMMGTGQMTGITAAQGYGMPTPGDDPLSPTTTTTAPRGMLPAMGPTTTPQPIPQSPRFQEMAGAWGMGGMLLQIKEENIP